MNGELGTPLGLEDLEETEAEGTSPRQVLAGSALGVTALAIVVLFGVVISIGITALVVGFTVMVGAGG